MYAGFLPLNESFLKGVVKIGNDSYINLGVHANFRNISCVHACKVACSVHAPMSFYSYLPLFRGPVGGVKLKKNVKMFFWQIPDLVLGKVRKNQRPSSHRFCAIAKTLRGGPPRPPPIGDRVNKGG